jgi:RhoGAP domain
MLGTLRLKAGLFKQTSHGSELAELPASGGGVAPAAAGGVAAQEPIALRVQKLVSSAESHTRAGEEVRLAAERSQRSFDAFLRDSRGLASALRQYAQVVRAQQSDVIHVSAAAAQTSPLRTPSGVRDRMGTTAVAGIFDHDDAALDPAPEETRTRSQHAGMVADVVRANEAIASALENAAMGQIELLDSLSRVQNSVSENFTDSVRLSCFCPCFPSFPPSRLPNSLHLPDLALPDQLGDFVRKEVPAQKDAKKKFHRSCQRLDAASSALRSVQTAKKANTKKLRDAKAERDQTHAEFLSLGESTGQSLELANKSAELLVFNSTRRFLEAINALYASGASKTSRVLAVMEDYKEASELLTKQRDARRDRFDRAQRNTIKALSLSVFGAHIKDIVERERRPTPVPILAEVLCNWLIEHAGNTEGVFRINANINLLNDVKGQLSQCRDKEQTVRFVKSLSARTNGVDGHVHMCAHLLKMFFRDLAEPLLTFGLYRRFVACTSESDRVSQIATVAAELPRPNAMTAAALFRVCTTLVENTAATKMTPKNLATGKLFLQFCACSVSLTHAFLKLVLSPNLLSCPGESSSNPETMMAEVRLFQLRVFWCCADSCVPYSLQMESASRVVEAFISNPVIQRALWPDDGNATAATTTTTTAPPAGWTVGLLSKEKSGDVPRFMNDQGDNAADRSVPPLPDQTAELLATAPQNQAGNLHGREQHIDDAPSPDVDLAILDVVEHEHVLAEHFYRLVQDVLESDSGEVQDAAALQLQGFSGVVVAPRVR